MDTELERLAAWMERNGYDGASLSAALNYGSDWLATVFGGKRTIRRGFRMRFAAAFGMDEHDAIFGPDKERPSNRFANKPLNFMAQCAVTALVNKGLLQPARFFQCVGGCGRPAGVWHHPSYRPNDHLNVVPLCRPCHSLEHRGLLNVPFGVVPTSVGLVRIAISNR